MSYVPTQARCFLLSVDNYVSQANVCAQTSYLHIASAKLHFLYELNKYYLKKSVNFYIF